MKTPTTPDGLRAYDGLDPVTAVIQSWNSPGSNPEWHERAKSEVRQAMPVLARALDRLSNTRG